MIEAFQLIRNIGQFDSVDTGRQLPLRKLSLIYAENGRGKTTLAAILRSFGNGDPARILERHRLGAAHPPMVVINGRGNARAMFANDAWQNRFGEIAVFDDIFVEENVCSGLTIEVGHRQNLHELIVGARGVDLSRTVQASVERIEQHNRELQARANAIPFAMRRGLSAEEFCALRARENIDQLLQDAERSLAAAREADAIQRQQAFPDLSLPDFDLESIANLLAATLADLEADAARRVQDHLATLGANAEAWINEGVQRIPSRHPGQQQEICPFCAQSLASSPLIPHYQAYFSGAYNALNHELDEAIQSLARVHGGEALATFERSVGGIARAREFWSRFLPVPNDPLDTAEIARAWKAAFEALIELLRAKRAAPLDALAIGARVRDAVEGYGAHRHTVLQYTRALQTANTEIEVVKERAAAANVATLEQDLATLLQNRERFRPETVQLCNNYLAEKQAKAATERQRDEARNALDAHRTAVFPAYQVAINNYLQRFNAGFRLASVNSVNTRGGSSCSYSVLINAHEVPISANGNGGPSFKTAMSSGDRNALALAFFFASLESDPNFNRKIVVIDDPMTSLDEHRRVTTLQEIRRLAERVEQVIVLSHSKEFLCAIWENSDTVQRLR